MYLHQTHHTSNGFPCKKRLVLMNLVFLLPFMHIWFDLIVGSGMRNCKFTFLTTLHLVTLSPKPAQTPTPNSSNLTITASADISHSHIFENCKISPRARYARIGCFYSRSSNLTIIAPSTIPHAMVKRFMHLYDEWNNNATYKVDRCLARYSPRATTTNRPTNRAPNEPARPGQK